VWLDGVEVEDIFSRFGSVQLTPEPVIDISGASGVTLILSMAHHQDWSGHVPGPEGLPGGYPVALKGGRLGLDLPVQIDRNAAITWNAQYESENGLVICADGRARYTGRLHERLKAESPDMATGFDVGDLELVWQAMNTLRERLMARTA
jgi:hypothetical protein